MSLENGPPCVHWRLKREREKFKKKKEERSDVKSDYGRGVVLFTISRMQKLRDLRDSELDKRPIKSLPAKSRPKSSTNPFPPPSGLFSSSMNRGGISNNARWKPTLPRVHSCGRSKMRRLSIKPWPSNNGRKEKIYYLRFGIFPA